VAKNLVLFILLAGLIGSFWYVRDFVIYGRLVPLTLAFSLWSNIKSVFRGVLTLGLFSPGSLPSALALDLSFLRDKALIPWRLTMGGGVLDRARDPGGVGMLFLAFLPLLLLPRFRKNKMIRFILYYSLVFFIIWAIFPSLRRYLVPIFPLLSIMVAYIIIRVSELNKFTRAPLFILVTLTLIFQMVYLAPGGLGKIYQRLLVFVGQTSQEAYILKNEETYPVYSYINRNLSPKAKLLIMDPRTFYCDRPYTTSIIGEDGRRYWPGKGEELLADLKERGVSYLVGNKSGWDTRYGEGRYPQPLEEIRTEHLRVSYDRYPFIVFQIHY